MESIQIEKDRRKNYRHHAIYVTIIFAVVALLFSKWGFTSTSADLSSFSENILLANVLFIGFVIAVNERVAEVFVSTFRRRTRKTIEKEIKDLHGGTQKDLNGAADDFEHLLIDYKTETGRLILCFSLCIGCALSSVGVVRIFGPLIDYTALVNAYHIAILDMMDVLLTGWLIAGGSQSWNKFVGVVESIFDTRKQMNRKALES